MDSDYLFANLPSALVEPLPSVSPLLSYANLPLSDWTSGVVARILDGTMPESWIDDLNPEQLRAATMGEGPVLTIAGAGTGKTKTLAARVLACVTGDRSGPDHASDVHAQGFRRDVAPGPESLG